MVLFLKIWQDLWVRDGTGYWSYVLAKEGRKWPSARYGHASLFVPRSAFGPFSGCLVIFGGRSLSGKLLEDLWAWNEVTQEWTQFLGAGERPPGTSYASLTLVEGGKLVLFGGQTEKSPRGSKKMWMFDGSMCEWKRMPKMARAQRRFRHCAWYNFATHQFCIYGGISGHAWHVELWTLTLMVEDLSRPLKWKLLPPPSELQTGKAIQSEVVVVMDVSHIMVLGAASAHVLEILPNGGTRLRAQVSSLPDFWRGNSPGVGACRVGPNEVLGLNLLSKDLSPYMKLTWNADRLIVEKEEEPLPVARSSTQGPVCHRPPFSPSSGNSAHVGLGITLVGHRWEKWAGQTADYFVLPKMIQLQSSSVMQSFRRVQLTEDEADDLKLEDTNSVNAMHSDDSSREDQEEAMPLLFVRHQKKRSLLKRIIDMLMKWEKRGAVDLRNRKLVNVIGDDVTDEQDLDCFGRADEHHEFDWRHFAFTLFRGLFMIFFALAYLFSGRFSVRAKLMLLLMGLVGVGVVAMPVVAYCWPPAISLKSEVALVWAPLVFYFLLVFIHSTIEGNWRDTGGSAASLNYLDSYDSQVFIKQSNNENKRSLRTMRGGELMSCLIEYEQSVMGDPWEYIFLAFVLSPFLGLIKAGLFILVDFLLVSREIPIDRESSVHGIFALSMFLNFVTMSVFLGLLSISAYVYRRQLRILRLVASATSKRESSALGIPFLPLRSVANVRVWSAMRTFAMSDKSHLPLTSANSVVGYSLVLTGILWIVLLVLVFVERSQSQLLVPINVSLMFFAVVLFYFVTVCIRQHVLLNKQLRSHSNLMGRELIRIQLAIDIRGDSFLEPTLRLMKHLSDLLKMELSFFRMLGVEINQNSLNSLLGLFLTLSVATITNIVIDLGVGGAPQGPIHNATSLLA